ncbi:sulfotransferase [Hansschlegelia sp.]|uniref:sulfotransferase n=1 Tax=Hansschlegelia sp. TaxID=2041892 RepID=UPI002CCD2D24|nr:sulfotransferase [Hansschlegelia sp.]HVI27301.1 sulfotransferase [Hansschlegelia sp.]
MAETAREDGPDFICIGLQKAGTQWLYDQLQFHPDFWMTPIKELNFFFPQFQNGSAVLAAQRFHANPKKIKKVNLRRLKDGVRPLEKPDLVFFEIVYDMINKTRDMDDYARLFSPKGQLLSGDVTPRFSVLDGETVQALADRFPRTKVILMLRDPVERAWSHWRMVISRGQIPAEAEQDAPSLRRFFRRPFNRSLSYPTEIAKRWRDAFGEDRFHFFFLDEVTSDPASVRERFISLLGGDPSKSSFLDPGYNRKAKPFVSSRTEPVQRLMRHLFEAERKACAETFGGPAREWLNAPY